MAVVQMLGKTILLQAEGTIEKHNSFEKDCALQLCGFYWEISLGKRFAIALVTI